MDRDIDRYTQAYLNAEFEEIMVSYRRKTVVSLLNPLPHQCMLEIGCGMHSIGNDLHGIESLTIVEPSRLFLAKAKQDSASWPDVQTHLVCGFFENEASVLAGRHYDLILISSLLHEVTQPSVFLKQVRTLCAPHTIIHVNVPNALSLHRLLAVSAGMIPQPDILSQRNIMLQQHHVYTFEALKNMLISAGDIQVLEKGSYFIKPFTHEQMHQCVAQGIFGKKVLDGLYNLTKYLPEHGAEIYINFQYEPTMSS